MRTKDESKLPASYILTFVLLKPRPSASQSKASPPSSLLHPFLFFSCLPPPFSTPISLASLFLTGRAFSLVLSVRFSLVFFPSFWCLLLVLVLCLPFCIIAV